MRVAVAVASILLSAVTLAAAKEADAAVKRSTNIPAQRLESALETLAKERHFQILYRTEVVGQLQASGAVGEFTVEETLEKILSGTGLTYKYLDDNAITIVPIGAATASGAQSSHNLGESTINPTAADEPSSGTEKEAPKSLWQRFRLAQAEAADTTQTAEPGVTDDSTDVKRLMLEEIIVTAQKREQRLQDVPISITALQAETLEQTGALALQDIARQVPGLTAATVSPGRNELVLRGLSGGNTVGVYVDEVPLIGLPMDSALQDLERVEVLRGPQGTLYGASSLGGTVRYITNQPKSDVVEADFMAAVSSTESGSLNNEVSAVANLPLVPDRAAVRAVAFYRDYDGFIDRYETDPANYLAVLPGTLHRDVNTEKTYGARISAALNLFDTFTVTPSIMYQRIDLGGLFTFESPPGSFDDPIQSRLMEEPETNTALLYSLTISGDIGPVNVTSATGYYDQKSKFTEDNSKALHASMGTPMVSSPLYATTGTRNLTEELRFSTSFGRVRLLAGAFYSRAKEHILADWPAPAGYGDLVFETYGATLDDIGLPGGPDIYIGQKDTRDEQRALFGELAVDLTDRLQATAGIRAFRQEQSYLFPQTGFFAGGASVETAATEVSDTSPKFQLTYRLTPSALTYVSATAGFRPGAAVGPLPSSCNDDLAERGYTSSPDGYDPDTAWSYELGAKTAWLNNSLTLNGAVYFVDWQDIQQRLRLPCGFNVTDNFGSAESKGGELELRYQTHFGLDVGLGAAFNQAEITENPGQQAQEGQRLINAPKWTGFASLAYRREIATDLSALARFDFNSSSYVFNDFDPASVYHRRAGYSLADVRFGLERESWQSYLFVRNAFDKRASTALQNVSGVELPDQRRFALNRPRTIGVELQVQF